MTDSAVRDLKAAQAEIKSPKESAAALSLLALVRHDHELDSFEVEPARIALGILSGITDGPLPKDLEAALKHAVPQSNVHVKNYDLTFDLSGKGPTYPSRAIVTLDHPAPADAILEVNTDRLTISSVRADGKKVPYTLVDNRLHVTAPGAAALTIDYELKADETVSANSFGLIHDKYANRMWTMTWPYNTGALFPSNSDPEDGATTRVVVKIAPGMTAVGSGTEEGGAFVTSHQTPAYANALYVAPDFVIGQSRDSIDGIHVISYGAGKSVPENHRTAYREAARDALEFYSALLGKFDYGPTLKIIELKGGLGGMEHTAAFALMLNAARDIDTAKEDAAHETAHHWTGDNVRIKSFGDFWMSEGFTNYLTYRFLQHSDGDKKFHAVLDRSKRDLGEALKANPHALSAPAYTDVNEIFDSVPYELGPWMLRMMEVELGRPKFDVLLRDWFQSHRQKAVSTDEFVEYAKAHSGHDFAPFFARWGNLKAVPRLAPEVKIHATKVDATLMPKNEVPPGVKIPLELEGIHERKTVMVEPGKPHVVRRRLRRHARHLGPRAHRARGRSLRRPEPVRGAVARPKR